MEICFCFEIFLSVVPCVFTGIQRPIIRASGMARHGTRIADAAPYVSCRIAVVREPESVIVVLFLFENAVEGAVGGGAGRGDQAFGLRSGDGAVGRAFARVGAVGLATLPGIRGEVGITVKELFKRKEIAAGKIEQ